MICNRRPDGWELIFQRAHAWLAYQMLLELRDEFKTPRWSAVLAATLLHDHGWREWEEPGVTVHGEPKSFLGTPAELAVQLIERGLASTRHQSLATSVLVARHLEYLFEGKGLPEQTLTQLKKQKRLWLKALGLTDRELEKDYELVLWADTLSLLLCVDDQDFCQSLTLHLHDLTWRVWRADTQEVWHLDPWPFRQHSLEFSLETYRLGPGPFTDSEELRARLLQSPPHPRTWILKNPQS